jgi:predicted nucleotidyltransferase
LERIAETMLRHDVEFIVIGGQAEYLFGSPRLTFDVDLCYRRTPANLERVAAALKEIGVTLRGAPPGLPFRLDARTLELGSNFTFDTPLGKLDLLGYVEPLGDFEQLAQRQEVHQLEAMTLRVIALDDLIRIKEHLRRWKDRDSLVQLLAIRQLRQEPPKE